MKLYLYVKRDFYFYKMRNILLIFKSRNTIAFK